MTTPASTDQATAAIPDIAVSDGLVTLGPLGVRLRATLEDLFLGLAAETAALPVQYPPLMRVHDLDRIGYFQKFPHLGLFTAGLTTAAIESRAQAAPNGAIGTLPPSDLTDATYALPSAACYNVYLSLAGSTLREAQRVTTVATCARREREYRELRRLLCFSMREIVCVGDQEEVLAHLSHYRQRTADLLARIGLPVIRETATDPFFDPDGAQALSQKLFPVKEEFVYDGSLAIASVNFHRNFFGEHYGISLRHGDPAFTGCMAFGIERWISALTSHFGDDLAEITRRLDGLRGT